MHRRVLQSHWCLRLVLLPELLLMLMLLVRNAPQRVVLRPLLCGAHATRSQGQLVHLPSGHMLLHAVTCGANSPGVLACVAVVFWQCMVEARLAHATVAFNHHRRHKEWPLCSYACVHRHPVRVI